MYSRKMLCKHESNPQKNNRAEARSQNQNRESANASPKIDSTFAEYSPPGEHLWDLRLYVTRVLNKLDYKKLLFVIYLHTK